MDSFDLFINKMIENHIKSKVDKESLKIINDFENKLIRRFNLDYFTKEGYTDYCKISNNLFLIHFIGDAQFVVLNRLFNNEDNDVTFKELYLSLYNLYNTKKIESIPLEVLTEEDINGIKEDIKILEELLNRGFFSKSPKIKSIIKNINNGDLSAFADVKCYIKNLKAKIDLEELGLTSYMEKVLPYYLDYETIENKLLDEVENSFTIKR